MDEVLPSRVQFDSLEDLRGVANIESVLFKNSSVLNSRCEVNKDRGSVWRFRSYVFQGRCRCGMDIPHLSKINPVLRLTIETRNGTNHVPWIKLVGREYTCLSGIGNVLPVLPRGLNPCRVSLENDLFLEVNTRSSEVLPFFLGAFISRRVLEASQT